MRYPGECAVNALRVGPNQKAKIGTAESSGHDTTVIVGVNNYSPNITLFIFQIQSSVARPSSLVRGLLTNLGAQTESQPGRYFSRHALSLCLAAGSSYLAFIGAETSEMGSSNDGIGLLVLSASARNGAPPTSRRFAVASDSSPNERNVSD